MKAYFIAMVSTGAGLSLTALLCLALSPLLGRRYGPRGLYGVWVALVIGLLVPFSLLTPKALVQVELPQALSQPVRGSASAPLPADGAPDLPAETDAGIRAGGRNAANGVDAASAPKAAPADWLALLSWVWLAGAAAVLLTAALGHLRFVRTVRRWQMPCVAEGYQQTLSDCIGEMNIRRKVALCFCPSVSSPMLMGLVHPSILLPDEELTTEELALVLKHELTHLKRGDLFIKAALLLCRALHWYNPAVWLVGRSLCFYQEASCDSFVTEKADEDERRFYSETIIRVIRKQARVRTALCTSFFAGRNGMKRRIAAIMQGGRRRAGTALCALALAATALGGGALALEAATLTTVPLRAWIHAKEGPGSILLGAPSANDIDCPMGIYLNGTPVTIIEMRESSFPEAWACEEGQPNWASVLIGGDGETTGIGGWMPLRDLAFTRYDQLPAARLTGGGETGHTTLYTLNTRDSEVLRVELDGTEVSVLGQLDYWLHVALDGRGMFVLMDDAALSDEADQRLYDLLPERFGGGTRAQYDDERALARLMEEKIAKYGHSNLLFWSLEDKAWYGQLEELYLGSHDHYYIMPGEDDLPLERAQQIALDAYAQALGRESVSAGEVDIYPGLYRLGYSEPRWWSFYFCVKDTHTVVWHVELSAETGEIRTSDAAAPPEGNG